MWQDKLKEIIYILEQSEVNEIDINFWGRKFRVVKSPGVVQGNSTPIVQTVAGVAVPTSTPEQEFIDPPVEKNGEKVLSPMPGTFYISPSPDTDPFVKEGTKVVQGDTLCIIEAMKIMNEIEAEISGIVREIMVENGQPVEYNQPLFTIDPA